MQQWQVGPVPEYLYSASGQHPNDMHGSHPYPSDMSRRPDFTGYAQQQNPAAQQHQQHAQHPQQHHGHQQQHTQHQQQQQHAQHPSHIQHTQHAQHQHHPQQQHHTTPVQPPMTIPQSTAAPPQQQPQQQPQQPTPTPAPAQVPAPRGRKRAAPSHQQHTPQQTHQQVPQVQQVHQQQQNVPVQQQQQHQPAAAPTPAVQQPVATAPAPAPVTTATAPAPAPVAAPPPQAAPPAPTAPTEDSNAGHNPPPAKKSRTNTPWTPAEELRLKTMRDAGNSWAEIAKTFPTRTEGSVKKHWYKDMHYAEFAEDESQALLSAIKEYENNKWKTIGQKVGKPAKACEQYAKEHFPELFNAPKAR